MTEGQAYAIRQLSRIESATDSLIEVLKTEEISLRNNYPNYVIVIISIYCGHVSRVPEGIPLRRRERFKILIPPEFPFEVPTVLSAHTRFGGYPHVQWGNILCLYLAPNSEWNPSHGIAGFVKRLGKWIEHAALDQLDPEGAPLHPPITYPKTSKIVVIRKNTPSIQGESWIGAAELKINDSHRLEVVDWVEFSSDKMPENIGAAILLNDPFPFFEFPETVIDIFNMLEQSGISKEHLISVLRKSIKEKSEEDPLYVIIGSPMRGIRGEEQKQHITAWYIPPDIANLFRDKVFKYIENKNLETFFSNGQKMH